MPRPRTPIGVSPCNHTAATRRTKAGIKRVKSSSWSEKTHNLDYAQLFEVVAAGCPQPIISAEKSERRKVTDYFQSGLFILFPRFSLAPTLWSGFMSAKLQIADIAPFCGVQVLFEPRSLCERQAGEKPNGVRRGVRCQTAGHDRRRCSRRFRAVFASFMAERRPSAGVLCD